MPEFLIAKYPIPFYLGGTSILIVVVVAMDTVTQVQTRLMSSQYESLIKKTMNKTVKITKTKIPTIISADKAPVLPNSKVEANALGISATIPEKIIKEIPLPTPLNVICSPSHIKKVVPATKDIVVKILNDKPGSITKFPAFSNPTETPYPCNAAINTVPYLVIWVIFFLPISPCSFKFLK